jgi:hypothetical protein
MGLPIILNFFLIAARFECWILRGWNLLADHYTSWLFEFEQIVQVLCRNVKQGCIFGTFFGDFNDSNIYTYFGLWQLNVCWTKKSNSQKNKTCFFVLKSWDCQACRALTLKPFFVRTDKFKLEKYFCFFRMRNANWKLDLISSKIRY